MPYNTGVKLGFGARLPEPLRRMGLLQRLRSQASCTVVIYPTEFICRLLFACRVSDAVLGASSSKRRRLNFHVSRSKSLLRMRTDCLTVMRH